MEEVSVKRCRLCILPLQEAAAAGDGAVCGACQRHQSRTAQSTSADSGGAEQRLRRFLRHRGRHRYDCVVPVSGGKDSSYVLWAAVRRLGLRVLALNIDNGYRSPLAVNNITRAVNKLGVDLVTYRPNHELLLTLFRTFLMTAGEFCTPCNMLLGAAAKRVAGQHGLRIVLTGNSDRLAIGIRGVSPATYYDRTYYLNVTRGVVPLSQVEPLIEKPLWQRGLGQILGIEPVTVKTLDYLQASRQEIVDTITTELGWESPPGPEHGDCLLNPVKDYLAFRKWGYSEVTAFYSDLVRKGDITRETALRKAEEEEVHAQPAVLPSFLRDLKMDGRDFELALERRFDSIPNFRTTRTFCLAKTAVARARHLVGWA